jgi:hypothetical protein
MKRNFTKLVGVVVLAILAVGCGADQNDATGITSNEITGSLKEWEVAVDGATAKAGEVTFTISNKGTIGHEFLVVKTDIALGEIPLDGDHFAEPTDGIEVIDEIGEFAKGTTEVIVLALEPGNYQLVCNLPDHYEAGMHASFTVS